MKFIAFGSDDPNWRDRLNKLDSEDQADVVVHERVGSLAGISEEIYNQIVTARQSYLQGDISLDEYLRLRERVLEPTDRY